MKITIDKKEKDVQRIAFIPELNEIRIRADNEIIAKLKWDENPGILNIAELEKSLNK